MIASLFIVFFGAASVPVVPAVWTIHVPPPGTFVEVAG